MAGVAYEINSPWEHGARRSGKGRASRLWAEEAGEEEEEQQREDEGEMETTSKGEGEAGTVMRDKGGRGPANIAGTQWMWTRNGRRGWMGGGGAGGNGEGLGVGREGAGGGDMAATGA